MKALRSLVVIMIFIISIVGITSATIAADVEENVSNKDYEIGSYFVPEILSAQKLSDFSSGGNATINGNFLWIMGTNMIRKDDGNVWESKIVVFDISKPPEPKFIATHEHDVLVRGIGFKGDYAYLLCANMNTKDRKRFYFEIVDISDPKNPEIVKKTDGLFSHFPDFHIHGSSMYVFESSSSGPTGVINKTRIYKFDLKDPLNPVLISDKIKDFSGKEIEFLEDYIQAVKMRDNFLYALEYKKVYVFDISNEIKLVAEYEGSMSRFDNFSLAEEYMSNDDTYLQVAGHSPEYVYPGDDIYEKRNLHQNAIVTLMHHNLSGFYPNYGLGQSAGLRIPFNASHMFSQGLLTFVVGHEEEERDPYSYNTFFSESKLLVVDFSNLYDPKFSGLLDLGGTVLDYAIKDNIAYFTALNQEGSGKEIKREFSLVTLQLPVNEGVYKRRFRSSAEGEIFPGYKEPEIKPNPMEAVLRDIIDKPTGQLTVADFKDAKAFDFEEKGLTDLNGIELCIDLEELNLGINHIRDLTPLEGLKKLKVLNLKWNNIEDISSLSNLENLEELNLHSNEIIDISPLLSLSKLSKLDLGRNNIDDFKPISKITNLVELKIGYSNIFRPPYLGRLKKLKVLNLSSNDIYYTDFIWTLPPTLEELNLNGNNIKDISDLTCLSGLRNLILSRNNLRDLSPLAKMTNLEYLNLYWNKKIEDFTPIGNLTNLTKLDLSELPIDDISFLEKLTNLEDLDLYHINHSEKKISNLSPLANLKKLQVLNASENEIENIKPLVGLTELVTLNLNENKIKSIKPLKNLKKLEDLRLEKNEVKDISPLSDLEKVKNLNLFGNEIKDVRCLMDGNIYSGCIASLGGNEIPEEQLNSIRKEVILLPNEEESSALGGLITIASCEKYFHELKGRYTKDLKEFVESGVLYTRNPNYLTMETLIRKKYKVALFEINDKGFTIVIKPEKDIQARTFAIDQGGYVLEWLGEEEVDVSKLNLDDDKWKAWPADCRFSVYSCGTGG